MTDLLAYLGSVRLTKAFGLCIRKHFPWGCHDAICDISYSSATFKNRCNRDGNFLSENVLSLLLDDAVAAVAVDNMVVLFFCVDAWALGTFREFRLQNYYCEIHSVSKWLPTAYGKKVAYKKFCFVFVPVPWSTPVPRSLHVPKHFTKTKYILPISATVQIERRDSVLQFWAYNLLYNPLWSVNNSRLDTSKYFRCPYNPVYRISVVQRHQ